MSSGQDTTISQGGFGEFTGTLLASQSAEGPSISGVLLTADFRAGPISTASGAGDSGTTLATSVKAWKFFGGKSERSTAEMGTE